tara:strand:- start:169 stop:321 length:153 start_codon:yes stop_codon:yes gene_type:complete
MKKSTQKSTPDLNQEHFKSAEKLNGAAALIGCTAAFISYGFTGHLIPGVL